VTKVFCDGCDAEPKPLDICLEIKRVDGMGGGRVPVSATSGAHLCRPCSTIAFKALKMEAKQ
jgi:hypothetical protein